MNKSTFLIAFVLFAIININPVLSQSAYQKTKSVEVKEMLISIAWQNSSLRKTSISNSAIKQIEIKNNKFTWLDGVWIGANINEFTINPPNDTDRNFFYPRYNFGYRLSYGELAQSISENKKDKKEIENILYQSHADSIKLRANVLRSYEMYLLTKELLQMEEEKLISINSELSVVEKEFTEGTTDISEYNELLSNYNAAKTDVAKAKYQYSVAIISLEELLGCKLAEAL